MGHLLSSAIKMQKAAATTTTTTTSASIPVNWFAELNCATASYSITKNGATVSSGGGFISDFGSFTCVVGDVLVASQTAGIKGGGCNTSSAQIDRNGVTVASQSQIGFFLTSTATWTVTAGTTTVDMYAGLIAA